MFNEDTAFSPIRLSHGDREIHGPAGSGHHRNILLHAHVEAKTARIPILRQVAEPSRCGAGRIDGNWLPVDEDLSLGGLARAKQNLRPLRPAGADEAGQPKLPPLEQAQGNVAGRIPRSSACGVKNAAAASWRTGISLAVVCSSRPIISGMTVDSRLCSRELSPL